jgi:hypothetical protein
VAFLGLDFYRSHAPSRFSLLFPLVIAAVPLLDAGLAIARRVRSRTSPLTGDRAHTYDLLAERGWPVRRILFAFYGVTAVLAGIGLFGVRNDSSRSWSLAIISVGLLAVVAIRLGALRGDDQGGSAKLSNVQEIEAEFGEPSQTD